MGINQFISRLRKRCLIILKSGGSYVAWVKRIEFLDTGGYRRKHVAVLAFDDGVERRVEIANILDAREEGTTA